jgi:hypothetical protein
MRMTFKRALGTAAVMALFFLFNFHVSSCTSGGGSTDSSGNKGGAKIFTPVKASFNSQFAFTGTSPTIVKCTSIGCASTDTSGNVGGTKYLLTGTIVTDADGHYELALIFTPKGDSANRQRIQVKSK